MPERRAKGRGNSGNQDHDEGQVTRVKRQKVDYSEESGGTNHEDEGSGDDDIDEDQWGGSEGGDEEGESEGEGKRNEGGKEEIGEGSEQPIGTDETSKITTKKKPLPLKPTSKEESIDSDIITSPHHLMPLTPSQLKASRQAVKCTGVVYLSRLPPFMRPQKVKFLLSRFGEIGRIFLSPEDPKSHARRVKFGGNKRINYEEGWVEFKDKRAAKLVAETLSTTIIGGKKGNYYHDDVWNIKYLPKFKWHHLQAQIAYENASRQAKLRAEIAQATRENKTFIRNVERAKMVENMQESRKRKADATAAAASGNVNGSSISGKKVGQTDDAPVVEVRRQFRQNKVRGHKAAQEEGVTTSVSVKKALAKLF